MKTWYALKDDAKGATLTIFDEIGAYGVSAKAFLNDLKGIKASEVKLEINSYGGDVFAGIAMYNGLRASGKKIAVTVLGIAASAASVVAMAGDTIEMPANAMMMIHNPWSFVAGDAEEMRATADVLDKIRDGLVATYAKRTGKSAEDITAMLREDTWLTAEEAVAQGFATKVTDKVEAKASFDIENLPERVRAVFNAAKPPAPAEQEAAPGTAFTPAASLTSQVLAVADAAGLTAYGALWAADPKVTTVDEAKARAQTALDVMALFKAAGKADKADDFIRSGKSVQDAREFIFAALDAESEEIDTTPPTKPAEQTSSSSTGVSAASLWAAHRKQTAK